MIKRLFFFLFLIFLGSPIFAQLEVKPNSFKEVPGFININTEKMYDDNDKPYAVLKIKTENIGSKERRELSFKGDAQTYFEVEYQDGEVWLYISYYASYIKISHEEYSSTEFYFPFDMKPKCGYELTLVNKAAMAVPIQAKEQYNYMIVKADQEAATIYIDDVYVGDGQVSKSFKVGEKHRWRIECKMYHMESGEAVITANEKVKIEKTLRPAFGYLNVTSQPENGATVFIDDDRVGVTPYKSERLKSGEHKVRVIKEMFSPAEMTFMVTDGNTIEAPMTMSANFASVTITTDSQSDIYIDNEIKGKGTWSGRLSAGDHIFEAKKASHTTSVKTASLTNGQTANIVIDNPTPIYGTIDINSDPMECNIIIDGVKKGETPAIINDVLVGNHELRIEKSGYKPVKKQFTLTEDKTLTISEKLEKGAEIPNGLVAYYPFDGNANDISGNGHHGTIHGNVTLTTGRKNDSNGAYQFPGQAMNYISVPNSSDLNNDSFTINAWVYTDKNDYNKNYIVDKGRDINVGTYRLGVDGVGACTKYNGTNGASVKRIPEVRQWHMITGTVTGNKAKFYIDGKLAAENTLTTNFKCNTSDPLTIGMHYYNGCPSGWAYAYYGKIDDLSIFNRALSSEEIAELYDFNGDYQISTQNKTASTYNNNNDNNLPNNLKRGLVAYYPFEGNANDNSGNNNNGKPEGATFINGYKGQCAHFGGFDNSQIIKIPNSNSLKFDNAATFVFWFKLDSYTGMDGYGRKSKDGLMRFFAKNFDRGQLNAGILRDKNGFKVFADNNSTWCETVVNGNAVNTWHHGAFVYTTKYIVVYIDGKEVGRINKNFNFNSSNGNDLIIGRLSYSWYPFHGCIDEFQVYNRELTAEEINQLFKE